MVEVAYELLCAELLVDNAVDSSNNSNDDDDEEDVVHEDFADQCRVLAENMPDSHVVTNHRSQM